VTRELQDQYQKCSKKDITVMLNGYNRCYACQILNQSKVMGYTNIAVQKIRYVVENKKIKRKKIKYYDLKVLIKLKEIWKICDYICSKKLAPFLSEIILVFEQNRKIILDKKVREKLFSISAATIVRLLADIRKKQRFKGKSTTRPGSLLKKNIPIRTFSH